MIEPSVVFRPDAMTDGGEELVLVPLGRAQIKMRRSEAVRLGYIHEEPAPPENKRRPNAPNKAKRGA